MRIISEPFVAPQLATLLLRQGGNSSAWATSGTTNYTPGQVRMQAGVINVLVDVSSIGGQTSVTFPTAFSNTPILLATANLGSGTQTFVVNAISVTASGFIANVARNRDDASLSSAYNVPVSWIAIGPM